LDLGNSRRDKGREKKKWMDGGGDKGKWKSDV
jgi:hypothetical protein